MASSIDAGWSDHRILETVGTRLRQERLNQNLTQQDLASRAGVQRRTISNVENGEDFTIGTLVRILRGLNQLRSLDAFLPAPGISPVQLAASQGRVRQRASGTPRPDVASDTDVPRAWRWGEDPAEGSP